MNIDEDPGLASRFDVLSIPTVVLFAGGEALGTVVGLRPKKYFDSWLAEVLPAAKIQPARHLSPPRSDRSR